VYDIIEINKYLYGHISSYQLTVCHCHPPVWMRFNRRGSRPILHLWRGHYNIPIDWGGWRVVRLANEPVDKRLLLPWWYGAVTPKSYGWPPSKLSQPNISQFFYLQFVSLGNKLKVFKAERSSYVSNMIIAIWYLYCNFSLSWVWR